jgi:NitT/TauT family transport system substrate-binding protein
MRYRFIASRHSAFYSPLLCAIEFLKRDGHEATYGVLAPGQQSHALIRDGAVDIMQSAVSSNWNARERGVEPLPVHFAQINQRDGFFLAARQADGEFAWKKLEGATLLADHGPQPLAMLKYAARQNGVEWSRIKVVNAGTPEKMIAAFRDGRGDYLHLQAPVMAGEAVASVGASMPPVAFSSLCCSRAYRGGEACKVFLETYRRAREWVRSAPAAEVAAAEAPYFPGVGEELLVDAIAGYQALGCWDGGVEIPRELYDQALTVFLAARQITWRHPYGEVVG